MMKFSEHEEVAKKYNIGTGGFWRPEKGENRVRVLTGFGVFGSHWIKKDNRSYTCVGSENNCVYCSNGDKPRARFLFWIIDRKDGQVKLAETGYSIIKQLGELGKSDDWGFGEAPDYDIVIKKTGEALETEYFVTPTPNKKKLTKEEKEASAETVKPIEDIIEKMKEKVSGASGNAVQEVKEEEVGEDEVNVDDIPF